VGQEHSVLAELLHFGDRMFELDLALCHHSYVLIWEAYLLPVRVGLEGEIGVQFQVSLEDFIAYNVKLIYFTMCP